MSAGHQRRALLHGRGDVVLRFGNLRFGDQRPHHDAGVAGIADRELTRELRGALHDLGLSFVRHEDPRRERAALALVGHEDTEAHVPGVLGGFGQVDRGGLPAELEMYLLHRRRRLRHDLAAHLRRPRERDHVDRGMCLDELPPPIC